MPLTPLRSHYNVLYISPAPEITNSSCSTDYRIKRRDPSELEVPKEDDSIIFAHFDGEIDYRLLLAGLEYDNSTPNIQFFFTMKVREIQTLEAAAMTYEHFHSVLEEKSKILNEFHGLRMVEEN